MLRVAIKAENLYLGYGDTLIVKDVSINIPRGSFCSVIGPNGCGKSTLLKALSRNLPVRSGTIFINGKHLKSYDTKILSRKLAFLTQSPHIPDQFSVKDLVSYGRFPHTNWIGILKSKDYEMINWAMDITEITRFEERELTSLSGGERQRVWIAMALAQEAEILLLDEPTTHLDIAHQFHILELIHKLNREMKRTVLMVLHDLNQAARYSDYLYVLNNGRLHAHGSPNEIITETMLREVFSIDTKIIRDEDNDCPYFIPLGGVHNE